MILEASPTSCARPTSIFSWCRAGSIPALSTGSRGGSAISRPRKRQQDDGSTPTRTNGSAGIIAAVATTSRPAVLVAHSLGVIAVAHAAPKLPRGASPGPSSWRLPTSQRQDLAKQYGHAWPQGGFGFPPVPLTQLPFPSMLLASTDDPFCSAGARAALRRRRGSELIEVGPAGHISADSGHGAWPDGVLRFGRFLGGLAV